ncbi:MAG: hypothetical protein F4227_01815 [Gammaproteobacteria bacterium]|nr:hypothetical protein [Gammaproteobacteria bacterium]MYF01740.1 hypothetical protein [Gammaproteobacteria bacterium]MYI77348.1 hypothetical protein [Gammaproteobacteria bacterium]
MAKTLKVHRTTIAREVRRNADENGHYDAARAHQRAQERCSVANAQPHAQTAHLWEQFTHQLQEHSRHRSPAGYQGRMQYEGQECLSRSWLYVLLQRDREQSLT